MLWAYVQIELKEKYLKLWSMKVYMMAIGNHLCSTHCLKQEKWTAREKGKGKAVQEEKEVGRIFSTRSAPKLQQEMR